MKYIFIFVLFLVKLCGSNDLKCGRSDGKIELVELYCENYPNVLPNNCTGSFLYWIGAQNKSNVIELKIAGCDPIKVTQFLEDFKNILSLDISYSGLESLDSFDLNLEHLVKLNVSHNKLMEIPTIFFTNLTKVVEIDLSYNQLTTYFKLPEEIEIVHMSHNKINDFDFTIDLRRIKYLDMRHNKMYNIKLFDNLIMKTLRLEHNKFSYLDTKIINTVAFYKSSAYISWKDVTSLSFSLHEHPIHITVNGENEGLFYRDGKIELQCNELGFKNTERFHISNVENPKDLLRCLTPSLKELELVNCNLGNLDIDFIQRFDNLREINLNNCSVSEFDLIWLKDNVLSIDIPKNNLKKLGNVSLLKSFDRLMTLDVSENQLENVTELIQYLNPRINFLYLSGNNIGKLNDITFENLKNLDVLYLNNTNLSFESLNPFKALKYLEWLNLEDNKIDSLDLTSMPGERLYTLELSGNNLMELENLTPSRFPKLRLLEISNNLFPCDYLEKFVAKVEDEFDGRLNLYEPWKQKHGDCRPEN